jgi:hypothetical protein
MIRKIATAAALSVGMVAGLAGTAGAASASAVPRIIFSVAASASPVRLYGNNGWYSSSVKPSSFSLGQGGSPGVGGMRWSRWTTTAYGTGTLYLDNCVPNCAIGHVSKYPISVILQHVKMHGSTRYFATMEWRWYTGGHLHTGWFTLGIYYAGATQPMWKPI